ncbi:DNA repair and recombination protein RAD54B [Powellomyces hirtus]|nr:DNA repair and recombination protein RAD54B [Powellomyces hirtus]
MLIKQEKKAIENASADAPQPPAKRQRAGPSAFRSPLLSIPRPATAAKPITPDLVSKTAVAPAAASADSKSSNSSLGQCYGVVYRKKQQKKHKTWESDGILIVQSRSGVMHDSEGKVISRIGLPDDEPMSLGVPLSMGGLDVEISSLLSWSDYTSGRCFALQQSSSGNAASKTLAKFKAPLTNSGTGDQPKRLPTPRHNPLAANALVMPRPATCADARRKTLLDVVVDPFISCHLRPHQRDGVRFLYECVCGMRDYNGAGAILADEMGLGKSVQTIALLWTLLKQSPYHQSPPPVKRALIICPASLVDNWKNEFKKWLGDERIRILAVRQESDIANFAMGRVYHVLVVGYEKLRICLEAVKNCNIDIVVCDEGHRLKNAQMRTAQAISSLQTKRRIILTGTPMQNDLGEFYSMVDLVNPGILGSPSTFKRVYEDVILRSRETGCTEAEYTLGQERSLELAKTTEQFVLRRTNNINAKYLPPKHDLVVFCRPTPLQTAIYRNLINSSEAKKVAGNADAAGGVLGFVTMLKKLVNSANLVTDWEFPAHRELSSEGDAEHSGKLMVLAALLEKLKATTDEKIVIVSNWTQTLDMIGTLCDQRGYSTLRLDGQIPAQKRVAIVDAFNSKAKHFVMLLSSKAGGVGLNLIGASRLVLFDIDWNPSVCQQAMARVWRDGQRREVYIYRFISTGTIEEKIYQRQLTKQGLSDALIDKRETNTNDFSMLDLKDIFLLDEHTECSTHDLLACDCLREVGNMPAVLTDDADTKWQQLQQWRHVSVATAMAEASAAANGAMATRLKALLNTDPIMTSILQDVDTGVRRTISFLFHKTTTSEQATSRVSS